MILPQATPGILMNEHQFVLRMIDVMRAKIEAVRRGAKKPLTPEDAEAMQRLIDDHVWARGRTRELVAASERY